MPQLFKNNAYASLGATAGSGDTSLTLATGTGARFGSPTGGDFFLLTLIGLDGNGLESSWEIVKVTARSTDTLTVVRAQEGTTAAIWPSGTRVEVRATAGTFEGLLQLGGGTLTGDLTLSGTGRKILADFSNATASLRAAFQSSTTNGNTIVVAKPNGTATAAFFIAHNAADADNSSYSYFGSTATEVSFRSDKTGSGTYLPIGVYAGAAKQLHLLATSSAVNYLTLSGATAGNGAAIGVDGTDTNINLLLTPKGTGAVVSGGNLAVNGGSITTTQTTANLLNATATTLNIGGAATALTLGATTGTMTLNNPIIVGSQASQDLFNTVATTLNVGGAATALTVGATSGTMTLRNPTIVGSQTTQALFNTVATTVNAFGAATAVNIGASTGTTTIANTLLAKAYKETYAAIGASDLDLSTANYFSRTISGTTTLTVSNVPASGTATSIILELTNGGSATVNWWTGVKWAAGTAPTLTAAGRDVLGFFTRDGGTTWSGFVLGKDVK